MGTYILHVFVCRALTESLVTPMQGKMEDFKKLTTQLDKEHNKGDYVYDSIGRVFSSHINVRGCVKQNVNRWYVNQTEMKKVRAEMKKMATNTVKLQKKVKKGG